MAMLEVVLSAIFGAYLPPHAYQAVESAKPPVPSRERLVSVRETGPGGRKPVLAGHYQSSTKGWPVARKWPTLMHSVSPIRTRLASG